MRTSRRCRRIQIVHEKEEIDSEGAAAVDTDYQKRFNLIDSMKTRNHARGLSALHVNPEIGTLLDEGTSAGGMSRRL